MGIFLEPQWEGNLEHSGARLLLKRSEFLETPNFNNMNSLRFNSLNRSQFSVDMGFGAQAT
jgi:hypothetical protein